MRKSFDIRSLLVKYQDGGKQLPPPAPRTGSRKNEDGSESTHLYAWGEIDGKYIAFPTLFQNEDGEYYEAEDPLNEAFKKKEVIYFDTQKEAEEYAEGAWKKFQIGGKSGPDILKNRKRGFDPNKNNIPPNSKSTISIQTTPTNKVQQKSVQQKLEEEKALKQNLKPTKVDQQRVVDNQKIVNTTPSYNNHINPGDEVNIDYRAEEILANKGRHGETEQERLNWYNSFTPEEIDLINRSSYANRLLPGKRARTVYDADQAIANKPFFSADRIAQETAGTPEHFRLFPNLASNAEDYLNPFLWIGNMAADLGAAPKDIQQGNYGSATMSVLTPLGAGALGGLGTANTKQFAESLLLPLGGAEKGLFNRTNKQPINMKKKIEDVYRDKTQQQVAQLRANRLLNQKEKWVNQPVDLDEYLLSAGNRHISNMEAYKLHKNPGNLGINTVGKTYVFSDAPLTETQKKIVAAHESGHHYNNTRLEGESWRKHFNFKNTPYKTKKYLVGRGLTGNGRIMGDELRERAAQIKDYIAIKNDIPLDKDFKISKKDFKYALKNYVDDVGFDNSMTAFIKGIKNRRGLLKEINTRALSTIGAASIYSNNENSNNKKQKGGFSFAPKEDPFKQGTVNRKHGVYNYGEEDIEDFTRRLSNSGWYKDRLKNNSTASEEEIQDYINKRNEYLDDVSLYETKRMKHHFKASGRNILYPLKPRKITKFLNKYNQNVAPEDILAHEFDHATNDYDSNPAREQESEFMRLRASGPRTHVSNFLEGKADLNGIRHLYHRLGLFDVDTGEYKTENKLMNKELLNQQKDNSMIKRMVDTYGEDGVVDMLNHLSSNKQTKNNDIMIGQKGGILTSYIQKPFDIRSLLPKYKNGGCSECSKKNLFFAQDGMVVSELYEQKTGKPWRTAKEEGLTDGSFEKNMQLRDKLVAGEFENNNKNNPMFDDSLVDPNAVFLDEAVIYGKAPYLYKASKEFTDNNPYSSYVISRADSGMKGDEVKDMYNKQKTFAEAEAIMKEIPIGNKTMEEYIASLPVVEKDIMTRFYNQGPIEEYELWDDVRRKTMDVNKKSQMDIITNYHKDSSEQYLIVDKKAGKAHLYVGDKELYSYNIGLGENTGDEQTQTVIGAFNSSGQRVDRKEAFTPDGKLKKGYKTKVMWDEGNKTTGAGIYTVSNVNPSNSSYSNAPTWNFLNENGIEVPMAIHSSFGDRTRKINIGDSRFSNGCINGKCNDLKDLYRQGYGEGQKAYVLPDNEDESKYSIVNGKLVFKSKNPNVNRTVETLNYKPIKIKVNKDKFEGDIYKWYDFNDDKEFRETTVPFIDSIEKNKKLVMTSIGIDGDVYNDIAKVALGILGVESNYGDTHNMFGNFGRATNKFLDRGSSSSPDWKSKYSTYRQNKESNSVGPTQIRFNQLDKSEKEALEKVGITDNSQLMTPQIAALATVVILAKRYQNQLNSEEKKDIYNNLPKTWNKRGNYTDRVKNGFKYFEVFQGK